MTSTPKKKQWPSDRVERRKVADLVPYARNARTHSDRQVGQIAASIMEWGWTNPILVDENGQILAGHGRLLAAEMLGLDEAPVMVAEGWSDAKKRAYIIADNKLAENAGWDEDLLAAEFADLELEDYDLELTGFEDFELDELLGRTPDPEPGPDPSSGSLADRFGLPPFSVLDARSGWWRDRRQSWLDMGIQSELGRGQEADEHGIPKNIGRVANNKELIPGYYEKRQAGMTDEEIVEEAKEKGLNSGVSVFDPVLCEVAYKWFCPSGGRVLDPFAGGSVRGITAAELGLDYVGIELRPEQVEANRAQLPNVLGEGATCEWVTGDSVREVPKVKNKFDFVFTCPPYADTEVYSELKGDLSNVSDYGAFLKLYGQVIEKSISKLKQDRFAAVVVSEIRTKDGSFRGFVPDTIRLFEEAGASFYNEAVIVQPVGSLAMRAGRIFEAGRKLGRVHQVLLVFVKGDWKKATKACGQVEFRDPEKEVEELGEEL